jgi:hypothetical protein
MTPATLRAHMSTLRPIGLEVQTLARLFGYASRNSVRQMLDGRQAIPDDLAAWVEGLAAWVKNHPTPTNNC